MSHLLDPAISAFFDMFVLHRLLVLSAGVVLGLCIGVIPGIGGLVGMALLLPFTYALDPATAIAFLIGMWSVTPTSDTIPSVLLGVPGSAGSSATVMDGYPMARRGEAGRALGAAYTASVIGGLMGAIILGVSIPVLRPLMLSFGTPELLALCIVGLMLVAAVSQGQILKGLVAASIGVILASVGDESQSGQLRWTFGTFYLWDGVPLVALVLGLFAVPEMIDVAVSRRSIAGNDGQSSVKNQFQGVRDAIKNWRIVLNSSFIGSALGGVPGLGGATVDWMAYGSAARLVKGGSKTFGTGDVRGVIASEAANNSKEGGALIPTIAFGIPGSATMAILLGAFVMHGIQPGPNLLSDQLDITYTMVWSLVIGNIIGAAICFALVSQLAKIALIPSGILVPAVLSIVYIGAYQATRDIGDLIALIGFSALGWTLKRFGWARPPVLLGFILGGLVEQYLLISTRRYGFEWLERPGVVAILAIPLLFIAYRAYQFLRRGKSQPAAERNPSLPREEAPACTAETAHVDRYAVPAIWGISALFFALAIMTSWGWDLSARLMPQTVSWFGLMMVALMGFSIILRARKGESIRPVRQHHAADALHGLPEDLVYRRAGILALWVLSVLAGTLLIGLPLSMVIFMFTYMVFEGKVGVVKSAVISIGLWICILILFDQLLNVPWPHSYLGDTFPALRRSISGII